MKSKSKIKFSMAGIYDFGCYINQTNKEMQMKLYTMEDFDYLDKKYVDNTPPKRRKVGTQVVVDKNGKKKTIIHYKNT